MKLPEDATVEQALKAFEVGDVDIIPAMENGTDKPTGVLQHESIVNRYRKEILKSSE